METVYVVKTWSEANAINENIGAQMRLDHSRGQAWSAQVVFTGTAPRITVRITHREADTSLIRFLVDEAINKA